MRRTKKSVSALIVALCMLVQLIPAFPVQTAEAANSFTVSFDFSVLGLGNADLTPDAANPASIARNGWAINSTYTTATLLSAFGTGDLVFNSANGKNGLKIQPNTNGSGKGSVAFDFNVATAGYYDVSVLAQRYGQNHDMNVYVATPELTGTKSLGYIPKATQGSNWEEVNTTLSSVYLNAGVNTIIFENGGTYSNYMILNSFTLTENTTPAMQEYKFSSSEVGTVYYRDANIMKNGWEVSQQETTASVYNNVVTNPPNNNFHLYSTYGRYEFSQGQSFAIDVIVNVSGYYDVSAFHNEYNGYGIGADAYIDNVPIGSKPDAGTFTETPKEYKLNAMYLTAGKHTIKYVRTDNSGGAYVWFAKYAITPATVNAISADAVTVSEGNTAEAAVTYQTTAGTAVANPITVKSKDEATATASYAGGKLSVKGVKVGSTTLTLTDVTGITEEVAVTVTEPVPVEKTIKFVADGTNITNGGKAEKATLAINGWQINETETTAGVPLTNAKAATVYSTYMGVNPIGVGNSVAYDFEVAAAGEYDVALTINAAQYYQGIFDVYINNALVGRIQGDSNGIYTGQPVLGMKTATLNKGVNTVKFTLVGRDRVVSTTAYGTGGGDYYLYPAALKVTPVEQGNKYAQEAVATVVGDTEMNVGGEIKVSAALKYDDASEEAITVKAYSDGIVSVAADGTVKALKAGSTAVYADVTVNGELYEVRVPIAVSGAPGKSGDVTAESAFGTAYAYIEDEYDGNYKVTFVGGVDELEGFAAIGYEISVDGGEAEDVDSSSVYTSLSVNGTSYNAATYGGKYIFIGSKGDIKAGSKVTARPYGKDAEGNKTYHGDVVLSLQL